MLNNKKFNIVLSLIIAVGLWAYVIGETNPTDTRTFRDIPITFVNGEVLANSNLCGSGGQRGYDECYFERNQEQHQQNQREGHHGCG